VQAREALWVDRGHPESSETDAPSDQTKVVFVGDGRQGFDFLGFTTANWNPGTIAAIATCNGGQAVERSSAFATGSKRSLLGNSSLKYAQVDDYVRERLALFLTKKTGQHGRH
jgi:hypothetical protein